MTTANKSAGKRNAKNAARPAVIERIQATGSPTPAKQTGDLAQTSVGLTGSETTIIGLMNWSIDWKRKTVEATTTDSQGYENNLGSTAGWTATAEYAYVDGDPSQAANLRAGITTLPTTSLKWNFFNAPASGRDSFSGNAIIDGISLTTGVGKIFAQKITLKGDGPLNIVAQQSTNAGTASDGQATLGTLAEN